MKSMIIDLFGLAGFSSLVAGLYLQYGTAITLMAGGASEVNHWKTQPHRSLVTALIWAFERAISSLVPRHR